MTEFSENQKEYLDKLFKNVTTALSEKTSELKNDLKTQIGEIKYELNSVINQQQEKITALEIENKKLQKAVIQLQRKVRKNNLVIFGIKETQTNITEQVTKIFKDILEIEILSSDINDVYEVGRNGTDKKPVIVELNSYQKKLLILKNSSKLKGKNIYIANDLCWEDREVNNTLNKHLKEARSKGAQAYIKGQKLIIANEPYTVEDLEKNTVEEDAPIDTKIVEKESVQSLSAPSTPNSQSRQKRLIHELGAEETEHQDQKKEKQAARIQKKCNTQQTIKTRSNSVSTKQTIN